LTGISWRRHHPQAMSPNIPILVRAALALFSLLIGFTFSMTLSRLDLNEMIDLQETRLARGRNRAPAIVFVLLGAIAVIGIG